MKYKMIFSTQAIDNYKLGQTPSKFNMSNKKYIKVAHGQTHVQVQKSNKDLLTKILKFLTD